MEMHDGWVLVVDDEPSIRFLIASILEDEGYEVAAVRDGLRALRIVDEEVEPGAVILDLDMPEMDGRSCFRALRARGVTAPVVILSAHGAREAARDLGADASIDKPFDAGDLIAQLQALGA